ncbi:MAG: 2-dehydropantoate 2-reductase [Pseudomonadota bacterium]
MHFTIVGAGALGTILAAHLVHSGHRVSCVVRENRAKQLHANGLRITGLKEMSAECEIITDPATLDQTNVLIVGTKTYQTLTAIESLRHLKLGAVFSIANGVKKNEQLASVFQPKTITGCMANVSGELLADGTVNFTRNVCLHLGALEKAGEPMVETVAEEIDRAGVVCRAEQDIRSVEWSKYVGWVAFMSLAAITRARTCDFLMNANHADFAARLIKEMAEIARAKNIKLIDQSPMPVKTIAEAPGQAARDAVIDMGQQFAKEAPEHRLSALQDLERGARLEHEDTLGYALEQARALDLPAATIADCFDLVSGIDAINRLHRG